MSLLNYSMCTTAAHGSVPPNDTYTRVNPLIAYFVQSRYSQKYKHADNPIYSVDIIYTCTKNIVLNDMVHTVKFSHRQIMRGMAYASEFQSQNASLIVKQRCIYSRLTDEPKGREVHLAV